MSLHYKQGQSDQYRTDAGASIRESATDAGRARLEAGARHISSSEATPRDWANQADRPPSNRRDLR